MKFTTQSLSKYVVALLMLSIGLAVVSGCKKKSADNITAKGTTITPDQDLIAYKNSPHHIFVGYLVGDGNDPVPSYNPANSPDSVDFLEFFAGNDTIQTDWRAAQAKGTRIVVCHDVKDAYFDGSVNDPATQVPGYVNPTGFNQTTQNSTSTYYHWAANTYNKIVVQQQLNGIDLDIESGTFGNEVSRNNANADSLVVAMAQYFGPNCTQCAVDANGKKPVFFYDTDGSSGVENSMYAAHKSNYDYCLFQSYTTGNHYWNGTGTASFGPLVSLYGNDKLVYLVNGDSFIYPDSTQDQAGGDAKATSDLYSYANYIKTNNGAGVGAYRMSRDYNHKPPFAVSRHAIQIMNPAH